MIDLASLKSLKVATGGTHFQFIKIGPDGHFTHAEGTGGCAAARHGADHHCCSNPVNDSGALPPARQITLVFNQDMKTSGTGAVIDLSNYSAGFIRRWWRAADRIGRLYNLLTRTVTLTFSPLLPGGYTLNVSQEVQSSVGVKMSTSFALHFTALKR